MQKLNEDQANYVRALMTGAGLIDHGNPLAYFTEYQVTPDQFFNVLMTKCPDIEVRQIVVNDWIEAYNWLATEHMFWDLVGDLEDEND